MSQLYFILLAALGIGFLVFIHEAGHYMCARLAGVRVLVFSLGFGPRLAGFRRGDTDYRLSLVPLGGYVRVAGEDPTASRIDAEGDLHSKSIPARAMFFAGGVLMNLLFALVAFPIVFRAGVEFDAPMLGDVAAGSPAWQAGLQTGDRILQVGDKETYSFDNLHVEIALAGDRPVDLMVERDGEQYSATVHPAYDGEQGIYTIGVRSAVETAVTLDVDARGPAYAAGARTGDTLVALNGTPVDAYSYVDVELPTRFSDGAVELTVLRDGRAHTLQYTPGQVDLPQPMLGVRAAHRQVAGLRDGLPLLRALDLRVGDRIQSIDGEPFAGGTLTVAATPGVLRMTVLRDGETRVLEAEADAAARTALAAHVGLAHAPKSTAVTPDPDSPAEAAGVVAGDEIVAINGVALSSWQDLRAAVGQSDAGPLQLVVRRGGEEHSLTLVPARRQNDLGFVAQLTPVREIIREESFGGALQAGLVCSFDWIKRLYVTLKKLFTGEVAAKNLGGIITISRVSYALAQAGWERFLYFLAVLSLNLAFINVLPIPMFDGGHLMFVLIEGIKGSPVSERVFHYSQVLGLAFIVALLVFVTYNDILKLP